MAGSSAIGGSNHALLALLLDSPTPATRLCVRGQHGDGLSMWSSFDSPNVFMGADVQEGRVTVASLELRTPRGEAPERSAGEQEAAKGSISHMPCRAFEHARAEI